MQFHLAEIRIRLGLASTSINQPILEVRNTIPLTFEASHQFPLQSLRWSSNRPHARGFLPPSRNLDFDQENEAPSNTLTVQQWREEVAENCKGRGRRKPD